MPVKGTKDMNKYRAKDREEVQEFNSTIRSQLNASEKYDKENVDNIRLRVPRGWKEQMQQYVKDSDKYSSVNAMICELIKKEIGL